jgi:hypothetical protein
MRKTISFMSKKEEEYFDVFKIQKYNNSQKLIEGFIIGTYNKDKNDDIKMDISFKFPSDLIFYDDTFNVRKKLFN